MLRKEWTQATMLRKDWHDIGLLLHSSLLLIDMKYEITASATTHAGFSGTQLEKII